MSLDEFKKIYFMEWTHRLWGRLIGVSFAIPGAYFIARRRVCRRTALAIVGISGLIAFQGFIGWWMVKSGLRDDLFAPGAHPRVSQYRLAAHLGTAFVCYGWMLLAGLSILRTRRLLAVKPDEALKSLAQLTHPTNAAFRRLVLGLGALTFVTVISGALVAGLDAGLIYNDFPWMGVGLAPPRAELWNEFYSRRADRADLWWRNMLENPSLVQLDHRILATTTFCAIMALWAFSRTGRVAGSLPRAAKKGMLGVVHLALLQVTLGITTLMWLVPTHLAATHQAGSLALLTGVLVLGHRLKVPPATLALLRRRAAAQKPLPPSPSS
jgi:cytochrome c oxidase assembly protein subunit 15